jgi:hypothetical protein
VSRLSDFLIRIYRMDEADEVSMKADLLSQMVSAWKRGIEDEAVKFGCNSARAKNPTGTDLRQLDDLAFTDAASIVATYNRDVEREILRLIAANPDEGGATYYTPALNAWVAKRNAYKTLQIALNTETRGREIGRQRFWQQNGIVGQFKLMGAPPVCPVCMRVMAMGTVSQEYMERTPAPLHINCVHHWVMVNPQPRKLVCKDIWTG